MGSSSSPSDFWAQFDQGQTTTTTSSSITSDATIVSVSPSNNTRAGVPHGSRPIRRRSRASRRTPTTLLTTDPVNFRAMVQQFTGGYSSNNNNNNNIAPYHVQAHNSMNFGVRDENIRQAINVPLANLTTTTRATLDLNNSEAAYYYHHFLQLQIQEQQRQQQSDQIISREDILNHRTPSSGLKVAKNEPFGRQLSPRG